jgi:tetratricopeptide (TPR) repeat protein
MRMRRSLFSAVLATIFFVASGVPSALGTSQGANGKPPTKQETRVLLEADRYQELDRQFSGLQEAYKTHAITDEDLRAAFRVFYDTDPVLASRYDSWVAQFPKSYVARLARAIYWRMVGDDVRGTKSTADTPSGQFDAMEIAHKKAMADFRASFALDPKPILSYASAMGITRANGDLNGSRELLDRANTVDRKNFVARAAYMTSIQTRWGGSQEMMRTFLDDSRHAGLPERQLRLLESIVEQDLAWIHEFEDGDLAAAEAAYRRSWSLGGDQCLPCFSDILMKEKKYREAIRALTEGIKANPLDIHLLMLRANADVQIGDERGALADWTVAANAGDPGAQNNLGRSYMTGIPGALEPNPHTGMEWFRKSAEQGNPEGIRNYATAQKMYARQGPSQQ